MVNHDKLAFGILQHLFHIIYTRIEVEVAAENKVRLGEQSFYLFRMLVVSDNRLSSRQPMKEIGKGIGHDNCRFLAKLFREIGSP